REQAESELAASERAASALAQPTPTPTAPANDQPTPEATVAPEELIALAKTPADTTIQVLDAGGGNASVDQVVSALETIGYDVVAINDSSRDVTVTTVYYTADNMPQAEGLRARDPRFQAVEPNQGLSDSVDIHVLVGPDF
ncbi:MAG TPA: LytR C-terminal domain-containing protein, partial [Euzebya sp.]|nr:LytR C-terminal domain-containing protein [Euzebya sp.]